MKVNIISIILFVTGIIVVIVGVYTAYQNANYHNPIGSDPYATTMDWPMFFMMLYSPVAFGMLLIGVSEVIRLLHKQQFTLKNNNEFLEKSEPDEDAQNTSDVWAMSEADEEKIYELYSDKAILEIIPTQKEGYSIIKLQDKDGPLNPYIKVVDVSGFGAKEVHDETTRREIMNWYENEGYQK
jgi:hypothetical protein